MLLGVGDQFAGASDIVVGPDGGGAYVSIFEALISQNGSLAQFSIGADGALTPKAPATVRADGHPTLLAVTPDGRNLYGTDQPDGKVLESRPRWNTFTERGRSHRCEIPVRDCGERAVREAALLRALPRNRLFRQLGSPRGRSPRH